MKYEELPEGMKEFIFLLEFLKDIPEDRIDLDYWANPCGTIFCAAGWATQIPRFQKKGLVLDQSGLVMRSSDGVNLASGTRAMALLLGRPFDRKLYPLFFGVTFLERVSTSTDKVIFFLRAQKYLKDTFNYDWTWT